MFSLARDFVIDPLVVGEIAKACGCSWSTHLQPGYADCASKEGGSRYVRAWGTAGLNIARRVVGAGSESGPRLVVALPDSTWGVHGRPAQSSSAHITVSGSMERWDDRDTRMLTH